MTDIIAVGYEIKMDDIDTLKSHINDVLYKISNSGKILQEKHPDFNFDDFVFDKRILSGVYYSNRARMYDDDCVKTDTFLHNWYEKHKNDEFIFIDALYYHYSIKKDTKNPLLIIVEAHSNTGDRFYSVLSNMTQGYSTTQYKRNIRNGIYGQPIPVNSIKMSVKSYIYKK